MSKPKADDLGVIPGPDDALAVALSLAKLGWPVFPVELKRVKKPDGSTSTDKRPLVRWLEGATTDHEQIVLWWTIDFPGAFVGVHAERAGLVVVDLDLDKPYPVNHPRAGERKGTGADNLAAAGLKLPKTLHYTTRGGGEHYVYAAPAGKSLTIRADHPVPGVDIRAGHGLMVYYGAPLTEKPVLAPAPAWAIVERENVYERGEGNVDAWLERTTPGKPSKPVKKLLERTDWHDLKHEPMLAAVSDLVKLGAERGIGQAYQEARAAYLEGRLDRARDWDNAATGSIAQHGMPPVTFKVTKAERRVIEARNTPEAVDEALEQRKREYRAKKHAERPGDAGHRVLEDGPLAVELADELADSWAWTKGRGLMRWTGKVWREAEPHELVEEVRACLDIIEVEEHTAAVMRGDNKAIDKARTLLSRNRARAVTDLVVGRLALNDASFDAHPDLLNTPTGVVDLRTGELLAHDPELRLTAITAADYDPNASMKTWTKALSALPDDVVPWLQMRLGQAATGYTPDDDLLVILEGAGENGKTTVIHAPRVALGGYSTRVPARLLDADPGDHPTTLMTLMGCRYAVIEELPEGRNLNVKRLKDAVGTPEITARRMRQDDVTFTATHGLFLSTNYLPIVAETDHGTWRRLALVRFPYRFVKRKSDRRSDRDRVGDRHLKRKLAQPDAGVLRWIVEGARAWYANDMTMPAKLPERIERDTEAWRMDADPVLGYVAERLVLDPDRAVATEDLTRDFNEHLERRGHRPWSSQTINARFDGHVSMTGVERKRVRFGRITPSRPAFTTRPLPANTQAWVGVRFVEEPDRIPSEAERDSRAWSDIVSSFGDREDD